MLPRAWPRRGECSLVCSFHQICSFHVAVKLNILFIVWQHPVLSYWCDSTPPLPFRISDDRPLRSDKLWSMTSGCGQRYRGDYMAEAADGFSQLYVDVLSTIAVYMTRLASSSLSSSADKYTSQKHASARLSAKHMAPGQT